MSTVGDPSVSPRLAFLLLYNTAYYLTRSTLSFYSTQTPLIRDTNASCAYLRPSPYLHVPPTYAFIYLY
jgi:hypothetical protein